MSGLAGLWSFDGTPPRLAPVLACLERRGPDRTQAFCEGPVALGHTLLATTPEALVERLPLTDPASGCSITADARIDNRDKLIAALDLAGEARVIGDGELILRAYLRWGEDCPEHFLGDFAFAIWDPRGPRMFCARDQMGMRQFNYCHMPGRIFAFATIDTALLAIDAVPKSLNEPRIADFIADLEGYDFASTFFDHILRLPPAHVLVVDAHGPTKRRYWTLRPPPRLLLPDDAAYAAAFAKVFTAAVRCRLRTASGLGVMVSGGIDSSAVAAVASRIMAELRSPALQTLSAVDRGSPHCPETAGIESMLASGKFDPVRIDKTTLGDRHAPLIAALKDARNPFEVNGTMLRSIYMAARENGLNVVLDGGAGDVVLSAGNRIAEHLSRGRIDKAWQETKAASAFWKIDRPNRYIAREILAGAWVAFVPTVVRTAVRALRIARPCPAIAPSFARQVDFANRQRRADRHAGMGVTGEAAKRAQSIAHPNLTTGRERYDQLAGDCGVESRDPFMDLRVIEFCLSLPPEQLQAFGWPKLILRRAMQGFVPPDIAWRRGKEHLGGDFTTALLQTWPGWTDGLRDPGSPLSAYVADSTLRPFRQRTISPSDGLAIRLSALDRFLRRFTGRTDRLWSKRQLS